MASSCRHTSCITVMVTVVTVTNSYLPLVGTVRNGQQLLTNHCHGYCCRGDQLLPPIGLARWCIASGCQHTSHTTAIVAVVIVTHSYLPLVGAVRVGLVVHSQQLPTHQLEIAGRIVAQLRQQLKGSSPRLVPGTSAAATARRRSCSPCHSLVDYRNAEITQHALKDRLNACSFQ